MVAASFALLLVFAFALQLKTRRHNFKRRLMQIATSALFVIGGVGMLGAGAWEAVTAASSTYSGIAVSLFLAAGALSLFIVWSLRRNRGPGAGGGPPDF